MTPTVAVWIALAVVVLVGMAAVAARRRRAEARRAYGPQGVGKALEHGRRRLRGTPDQEPRPPADD